ncbi:MAG: two-component system response regulator [Phycisphaerae bacterium]
MMPEPRRILLVEDNPAHAKLLTYQLDRADCRVDITWLKDGEAALEYLHDREHRPDQPLPDLILLDLKLPKVDGLDVLDQLKHDEQLRKIPVIILTTSSREQDVERAYARCVNAYLVKPMDYQCLHEMVRSTIEFWCGWNQAPRAD